jgi:hypothetical protein
MPLRFQAPTTPLPYSLAYSLDDFVARLVRDYDRPCH